MGMLGLTEVLTALGLFLHAVLDLANESLLAQLLGNYQYMLCLLLDGGMLSGTKLRTWLGKMVSESPLITAHNAASAPNSPQKTWTDGTKITFAQLYQAGCEQGNLLELAVTGTNATTERPVVFTRTSTPDFPVVEAVAISATLPLLFKPVWLSASMPFLRALPQTAYAGWYLDGGLTNNLPIHLFDTYSAGGGFAIPFDPLAPTAARPGAPPPLNKNMLGLLLMEGNKPPTKAAAPPPDPSGTESVLRTLGMLWGGLTFGATQGQLRSSAEVDQTVTIYSNGAGLLDLAAPGTVVDSAAQSGYDSLAAHYPDVTPAGP
jgi:predicted acylesterase/phospholipase RssA